MTATSSNKVDTNWYNDTSATDHIQSDLDCLVVQEQYHGGDSVKVGNGVGLEILHTGHFLINTAIRPLSLNHVLHVPSIAKDLISVHKLSCDNNMFFEFYPSYYLIKDRATRCLLLEGRCESGFYPLKPADIDHLKHDLVTSISLALVIRTLKLFGLFYKSIIFLLSMSPLSQFVMRVWFLRVINFLTLVRFICLPCRFFSD